MQAVFRLLGTCLLAAFPICAQNSADQPTTQAVASASSSDQADQTASIAGTVVAADTGQPLSDARVMLVPLDPGRALPTRRPDAISDNAGHFAIANIRPGQFMISVERNGYMTRQWGRENTRQAPAVLVLTAGQSVPDLLLPMLRPAVIEGRVTDKNGEPMAGAVVEALGRNVYRGKTTFTAYGEAGTDDHGEYRIFNIMPGKYWLAASHNEEFGRSGGEITSEPYPAVYYPKSSRIDGATPIHLSGGEEVRGVDFTLIPDPVGGYEISGKVTNAISNSPAPAAVALAPADGPAGVEGRGTGANPHDGTFQFSHVQPGKYVLTATGADQNTASQQIIVANADLHDVSLVLAPGIDITGHVTLDGAPSSIPFMDIDLRSLDLRDPSAGSISGQVQADGTFAMHHVADGLYNLSVFSVCDQCYLKSATSAQGINLLASGVRVASGVAPTGIEIVYSANTAEVNGTVVDSSGKPAEGAWVIVLPSVYEPYHIDLGRTGSSDQYGHFDIRGLGPGSYSVIAIQSTDDEDGIDLTSSDFFKPFGNKVRSIEVAAGDHKSLQLEQTSLGLERVSVAPKPSDNQ